MNVPQLERELERLLERYDSQPEGRLFAPLADCYRKLGRLDEAFKLCVDGLARHPRYSSGFVILGKIHLDREEHDSARVAFETVLSLDPDNLLALRQLAVGCEREDDLSGAIELWRLVAAIDPDGAEAVERLEALDRGESLGDSVGDEPPFEDASDPRSGESEIDQVQTPLSDGSPLADAESAGDAPHSHAWAWEDEPHEPQQAPRQEGDLDAATEPQAPTPAAEAGAPTAAPEAKTGTGADDPIEPPLSQREPASAGEPEVEPDHAPSPGPERAGRRDERAQAEGAEIVTMTLADIYYEQGFKAKALEMYEAVQSRSSQGYQLDEKIQRIRAELEEISTQVPRDLSLDDAPRSGIGSVPPVATPTVEGGPGAARDAKPEAAEPAASRSEPPDQKPATPIPQVETVSRAQPVETPIEGDDPGQHDGENRDHFRSWLEKIKLRDS